MTGDSGLVESNAAQVEDELDLSRHEFGLLYSATYGPVVNYFRYRVGFSEAEDLSADAYARAWRYRGTYDPQRGPTEAWFWSIVRRVAFDAASKRRRPLGAWFRALAGSSPVPGPESGHIASDQVDRALAELNGLDREIVALRFGAQHTNREIAAMLDMSESNVAQRLRRALDRMRPAIDDRQEPTQ